MLRVYLPTCVRDELTAVFGPVDRYLMESDGGDSLIDFKFDGNRLHERWVSVTPGRDPTPEQTV